ncbi:MAG: GNAT family N-acetyltransferase [Firmicutes bacterium]|nr:GNAT family N-acetyltransferase [Bacillota bacterium]
MIIYKSEMPVDEYNSMRQAVGWKVLDRAQAQTGLDNSAYLTAAWDGDKPVGMARVVSDGGYMTLVADVMVLPEYQGKGIGRQLMTNISEYFDSLGSDGRCIMVNLMATTGNEGFYRKFGFTERPNDAMGAGMVRWINE